MHFTYFSGLSGNKINFIPELMKIYLKNRIFNEVLVIFLLGKDKASLDTLRVQYKQINRININLHGK